jgi:hypothetical protein
MNGRRQPGSAPKPTSRKTCSSYTEDVDEPASLVAAEAVDIEGERPLASAQPVEFTARARGAVLPAYEEPAGKRRAVPDGEE